MASFRPGIRACWALLTLAACSMDPATPPPSTAPATVEAAVAARNDVFATVRLDADLSTLSEREREMLPLLIDAAGAMDEAYWLQAYGDRETLLSSLPDAASRRFALIHYGPWDRLDGNRPLLPGFGPKPPGARLYPADLSAEELQAAATESPERPGELLGRYTVVQRDGDGRLVGVPYHRAYRLQVEHAAARLDEAARLAEQEDLAAYLRARAAALRSDDYLPSDRLWLDMRDNRIEVVIGPIETYEDGLMGAKAAFESFVLLKDPTWTARLARYAALLPALQSSLPVPEVYRRETPGSEGDLQAYDAIYYAGDANAGAKTIAINLPNDEGVQLEKGTRRLQIRNVMRAKYERILLPLAAALLPADQQDLLDFDAFFQNVMFHEVAHGLGIKQTVDGRSSVREALRDRFGALEEAKADVLGLFMVDRLRQAGELPEGDLRRNQTTFVASVFRSIRFGAASAHGRANLATFHFLQERRAVQRTADGTYSVDFERMRDAIDELAGIILRLQGDGDYEAVARFLDQRGEIDSRLAEDLARADQAGVPVDIVFEQGLEVLGLSTGG